MTSRMIVFSDLDGTLLDHETYSFDAAKPALGRLKSEGHILVLASSKTAAEIAPLRDAMGFSHCPAIVENGAGLLEAGDSGGADDRSAHDDVLAALSGLPSRLRSRFEGFSDWDVAEVARRTGLSLEEAEKAAMRRFSEPGIWSGSDADLEEFVVLLSQSGITGARGGRFFTLSHGSTKASQMDAIVAMYPDAGGDPKIVALGDAPNDIPMLEKADLGIIIANRAHAGIGPLQGEAAGTIIRSVELGPEGWNEEMLRVLDTR